MRRNQIETHRESDSNVTALTGAFIFRLPKKEKKLIIAVANRGAKSV